MSSLQNNELNFFPLRALRVKINGQPAELPSLCPGLYVTYTVICLLQEQLTTLNWFARPRWNVQYSHQQKSSELFSWESQTHESNAEDTDIRYFAGHIRVDFELKREAGGCEGICDEGRWKYSGNERILDGECPLRLCETLLTFGYIFSLKTLHTGNKSTGSKPVASDI